MGLHYLMMFVDILSLIEVILTIQVARCLCLKVRTGDVLDEQYSFNDVVSGSFDMMGHYTAMQCDHQGECETLCLI